MSEDPADDPQSQHTRIGSGGNRRDRVATPGMAVPTDRDAARSQDLPAIDGIHIEREIGRGGMGVVYKARQEVLERTVAVKVLTLEGVTNPAAYQERFLREARILAELDHPHIVRCHQAGVREESPFLVLEFVEGSDLATWLERHGRMSPEAVIAWPSVGFRQSAHQAGLSIVISSRECAGDATRF